MFTCLAFILIGCHRRERLYTGSGYGLIECVKALMSYEDEVSSHELHIKTFSAPSFLRILHFFVLSIAAFMVFTRPVPYPEVSRACNLDFIVKVDEKEVHASTTIFIVIWKLTVLRDEAEAACLLISHEIGSEYHHFFSVTVFPYAYEGATMSSPHVLENNSLSVLFGGYNKSLLIQCS